MVDLTLIVPMYNEYDSCAEFIRVVVPIVEDVVESYEILCVDDGSSDRTVEVLRDLRKSNPSIKILCLSRNFGKEAALTAGLDFAKGDAVIPIDADLQDPPELIREMVEKWRNGADVVLARRTDRASDSVLKRTTSRLFYKVISKISNSDIPENVGDFRLMDRSVVEALKKLPERARFMKGLFAWVGYEAEIIDYARVPRNAGSTKFNYWKLWNFGLEGITSFTSVPLKVWSYFGVFISFLSACFMIFLIVRTLVMGIDTPGYASLMSVQFFFNGILLLSLGAIGEYLSRIYTETKQRPVYLIRSAEGVIDPIAESREHAL